MTVLWVYAFAWTLALELPIYVLVLHRELARWWMPIVLAIAVNVLTHPVLWFVFPRFGPRALYLVASELCVIAVEALAITLVIGRDRLRIAVMASALANVVSTLVGLGLIAIVT